MSRQPLIQPREQVPSQVFQQQQWRPQGELGLAPRQHTDALARQGLSVVFAPTVDHGRRDVPEADKSLRFFGTQDMAPLDVVGDASRFEKYRVDPVAPLAQVGFCGDQVGIDPVVAEEDEFSHWVGAVEAEWVFFGFGRGYHY